MKVKLLSGLHVTATNKRHIVSLIQQGLKSGASARINYYILEQEGDVYKIQIVQNESDDWGRPVVRKNVVTVEVK